MYRTADFIVVGGGIVGLALARELRARFPDSSIVVLEKESALGQHASGRNSGVLHSGIYYAPGSLKAKLCAQGARELGSYCEEHHLPIKRYGKVILPVREDDDELLRVLASRAWSSGARAELIDERALREMEPEARSRTGHALYAPDTAVAEPLVILQHLAAALAERGVEICLGHRVEGVETSRAAVCANGTEFAFGHLFNAAGVHADRLAHAFGVAERYELLPFKGRYYQLAPDCGLQINRLIYPVPDLRVPFLGVHFTKRTNGIVDLGPTAIPALGRENYSGLRGVRPVEMAGILFRVAGQIVRNRQGFRRYAREEVLRFAKSRFVQAARALVPRVRARDLLRSDKVGIRAQLYDRTAAELVMDFVIERGERSTHVLNAVSPGFTSAFPFARFVLEQASLS